VGKPLLAAYSAFRSGHAMNNQLLRALLASPTPTKIVSFEHEREAPLGFAQLAPAW
jgi:UDP-3-O-[3-hydroxymyristoyl] N-acetylglucosamine deacetylase